MENCVKKISIIFEMWQNEKLKVGMRKGRDKNKWERREENEILYYWG